MTSVSSAGPRGRTTYDAARAGMLQNARVVRSQPRPIAFFFPPSSTRHGGHRSRSSMKEKAGEPASMGALYDESARSGRVSPGGRARKARRGVNYGKSIITTIVVVVIFDDDDEIARKERRQRWRTPAIPPSNRRLTPLPVCHLHPTRGRRRACPSGVILVILGTSPKVRTERPRTTSREGGSCKTTTPRRILAALRDAMAFPPLRWPVRPDGRGEGEVIVCPPLALSRKFVTDLSFFCLTLLSV